MRSIYTALIALGTGIIGFLAGGGFGLLQGGIGGTVVGVALGTASGICTPVEAAIEGNMLTPAQVEELAFTVGQNLLESDPDLSQAIATIKDDSGELLVEVNNEQCTRFLNQVVQAMG